jgi:hypothetical protein
LVATLVAGLGGTVLLASSRPDLFEVSAIALVIAAIATVSAHARRPR